MWKFDAAFLLMFAGAAAVLVGAGFSVRAGSVVLTNSRGGPAQSAVAILMGLVLFAAGLLLKTVWGPQSVDVQPPRPTPTATVDTSSPPSVGPPTATVGPTTPSAVFAVALQQPVEGTRVPIAGTIAAGSATGALGDGETLWLFIASQGVHYLSLEITPAGDGTFSVPSGQVGSKEDGGFPFSFEIVRANAAATKSIDGLVANADGDRLFKRQFPPGASVMASTKVIRT